MNQSPKFVAVVLASLFIGLFLLQVGTDLFLPKQAVSFASHPLLPQKASKNPAPITVITGGRGGTGKVPNPVGGNDCLSGITSTPADVLKLLAPGWTINDLGAQYRNQTQPILCYDNWNAGWVVPGGTWLNITDFLKIMNWPSDLFNPSAGTQILILTSPSDAFQSNTPTNNNNGTPQNTSQTDQNCSWKPDLVVAHPTIDICGLIQTVLQAAILTPLKWGVNNLAGDGNSFVWTTPAQETYLNPDLALFWGTSLGIVNVLLVAVIAWAGLRYTISKSFGSWLSYAELLELIPRIVLALIAAYVSVKLCQIAIDGSNALGSVFSTNLLSNLQTDPQDLFTTFMQILLCVLILILVLEEAVRIAILFVLIAFSPIWAFCGALKETQFIFKGALKALFFMSLLQPAQIAVMALGQHLTANIGGNSGSLLYTFISIALMLLVLFMMSAFLRASGFSMPFGLAGVAGAVVGARMMGGLTRASGRGAIAAGRSYFKGSVFDRSSTSGGSNRGGGGPTNTARNAGPTRGGGSPTNLTGSTRGGSPNNPFPTLGGYGIPPAKVRRLPPYDPYKQQVLKKSRSAQNLGRHTVVTVPPARQHRI